MPFLIPLNITKPMTVSKQKKIEKKDQTSQYNASFNLYYDVILKQLKTFFYENGTIESDSKYGLANYSILRTLFDYVDEIIEDYPYTPEQLVSLINEHEKLKEKFEQKLLALTGEKKENILKVVSKIESK